jgi:uncharacterized membrane protein
MRLSPTVNEWINLIARWIHVFAAILWVGTTYYFTWLDGRFTEEEKAEGKTGETKQIWMVHSGGFYVVEKRKEAELTRKLHWFRWEAAFTWLSGMILLVVVYYMGGLMIDPDVRDISLTTGIAIGVGTLIVGGIVYDLMVLSPLGRNEMVFAVIAYALVVGLIYGLSQVLSGRAVYIHIGAMFGTIMAANVWMHILPSQRRMIAAIREGKTPDPKHGARAKLRSKHNTFMVVPVVLLMLSYHFPVATDGYNWVFLAVVIPVGWVAAFFLRRA